MGYWSLFLGSCSLICTSLFSESFGGEHGTISSHHYVSVVPAIVSYVVPK